MDPVSAITGVLGAVGVIAQVASAATAFMREVRSARKEMLEVKKQLSSLRGVLEILEEDFSDPANTSLSPTVVGQIVDVVADCSSVVTQMGDCIRSQGRSRLLWATSGKAEVMRLREELEIHKATLDLTLDLISNIILKQTKNDTGQILQDTTALREDTFLIQTDTTRILSEIGRIQSQLHSLREDNLDSNFVLERYLNDLKTDAQTVLGEFDQNRNPWEEGDESGWAGNPSMGDDPGNDRRRGVPKPILFTNSQGRQYNIPYATCKDWTGMVEIIRHSYTNVPESKDVKNGKYDLIGPNGSIILPILWEQLVEPGWEVTMKMWEDTQKTKEPIKFKDAVGRKFSFPFHLCQTWAGMDELIKQAFIHVEVIGPHVQEGHFDLIGPNGEIILPSVWERVIEPGWPVTMHMWPLDKAPLLPRHFRGPPSGPPRPPGFPPPPPMMTPRHVPSHPLRERETASSSKKKKASNGSKKTVLEILGGKSRSHRQSAGD